jgi:hypothetical protein
MPASGDTEPFVATPPPADGSKVFEDPQQVILVLEKSQAARFKAAAGFLASKNGSVTYHQAIYMTVVEAAEQLGFVHPATVTKEGNIDHGNDRVSPGSETSPAGGEAARSCSTLGQQQW